VTAVLLGFQSPLVPIEETRIVGACVFGLSMVYGIVLLFGVLDVLVYERARLRGVLRVSRLAISFRSLRFASAT